MEQPLPQSDQEKCRKKRKQQGQDWLRVLVEIKSQSPDQEENSRSCFEDRARPIFHAAVGDYRENDQAANTEAEKLHSLAGSAASGMRAASSTQASP